MTFECNRNTFWLHSSFCNLQITLFYQPLHYAEIWIAFSSWPSHFQSSTSCSDSDILCWCLQNLTFSTCFSTPLKYVGLSSCLSLALLLCCYYKIWHDVPLLLFYTSCLNVLLLLFDAPSLLSFASCLDVMLYASSLSIPLLLFYASSLLGCFNINSFEGIRFFFAYEELSSNFHSA